MDVVTRNLRGSPARDAFKLWHKTLDKAFYACDADLFLVAKSPPRIVALLDYKTQNDRYYNSVSFAEVLAYNDTLAAGIPVYIVTSNPPFDRLLIERYCGGDPLPNPPKVTLERIGVYDQRGYAAWERELRRQA